MWGCGDWGWERRFLLSLSLSTRVAALFFSSCFWSFTRRVGEPLVVAREKIKKDACSRTERTLVRAGREDCRGDVRDADTHRRRCTKSPHDWRRERARPSRATLGLLCGALLCFPLRALSLLLVFFCCFPSTRPTDNLRGGELIKVGNFSFVLEG